MRNKPQGNFQDVKHKIPSNAADGFGQYVTVCVAFNDFLREWEVGQEAQQSMFIDNDWAFKKPHKGYFIFFPNHDIFLLVYASLLVARCALNVHASVFA